MSRFREFGTSCSPSLAFGGGGSSFVSPAWAQQGKSFLS